MLSQDERIKLKLESALKHVKSTCLIGSGNKIKDLKRTHFFSDASTERMLKGEFKASIKNGKKKWSYKVRERVIPLVWSVHELDPLQFLKESQQEQLLQALLVQHERSGNCGHLSSLLVKHLWEHAKDNDIHTIEKIGLVNYDHSLVMINRKSGDVNDENTWINAWFVDPWYEDGIIYPASEFASQMLKLYKFANEQAAYHKKKGLSTWNVHNKSSYSFELKSIFRIQPFIDAYPTGSSLFPHPLEYYISCQPKSEFKFDHKNEYQAVINLIHSPDDNEHDVIHELIKKIKNELDFSDDTNHVLMKRACSLYKKADDLLKKSNPIIKIDGLLFLFRNCVNLFYDCFDELLSIKNNNHLIVQCQLIEKLENIIFLTNEDKYKKILDKYKLELNEESNKLLRCVSVQKALTKLQKNNIATEENIELLICDSEAATYAETTADILAELNNRQCLFDETRQCVKNMGNVSNIKNFIDFIFLLNSYNLFSDHDKPKTNNLMKVIDWIYKRLYGNEGMGMGEPEIFKKILETMHDAKCLTPENFVLVAASGLDSMAISFRLRISLEEKIHNFKTELDQNKLELSEYLQRQISRLKKESKKKLFESYAENLDKVASFVELQRLKAEIKDTKIVSISKFILFNEAISEDELTQDSIFNIENKFLRKMK